MKLFTQIFAVVILYSLCSWLAGRAQDPGWSENPKMKMAQAKAATQKYVPTQDPTTHNWSCPANTVAVEPYVQPHANIGRLQRAGNSETIFMKKISTDPPICISLQ